VAIENGRRVPLMCFVEVLFYDPDGKGKFSVMRDGVFLRVWKVNGEGVAETLLPDWVKALAAPESDSSRH